MQIHLRCHKSEKAGPAKLSQCVSIWDAYHDAARGGFQSREAGLNGIRPPEVIQAGWHASTASGPSERAIGGQAGG